MDVGSSLHRVTALSRSRLLGAAFLAAVAGGALLSLTTPETVSGSALPGGPAENPLALFAPPDSTPGAPGSIVPHTAADSIARARADSTRRDSVRIANLHRFVITDTTYVVDLDSTSRMRQFVYRRHDMPVVDMFPDRTPPLFAANHALSYRREVSFDSTGTNVRFRETVGAVDVKIPRVLPLADYIALRRKHDLRMMIAADARKTKALTKTDIGDVLSNITRINIPVPANPLFSIFGKNEINLNVTGAVDIKAGFRSTKSDLTTLSVLDQVRSEPDFNQEVQVNVNGTIGDKLNILADWNTKRTFEYENQLKIKYTGYDDEIVQTVEAGNVSLATPSAFIGSSQALFGIKAKFQLGPMTLTTLASQKKGQIKEVAVTGGAQQLTFQMRAFEYATNHFWVDTTYIPYYEPYYQKEPPAIGTDIPASRQIVEQEVWISRTATIADPNERQGIAYIQLDPRGSGYPDAMRSAAGVPGYIETGPMLKLDPTQYEMDGSGYIGVLSLNVNVTDQQIVAIAYRTIGGPQYGDLTRNIPGTDSTSLKIPLVLKLVKPKNLVASGPLYGTAWKQMLKNIYPIPGIGRNLKQQGFTLDIFRQIPGSQDQNSVQNIPLLRALQVDKYLPDGTPAPNGDGVFDFRPGRTVSITRAEIILPYVDPFKNGLRNYMKTNLPAGTAVDTTLLYPEVYDTTQTFAQQSLNNRYVMRGQATGEATSQFSLGFNVVEGSVQVLLDGVPLLLNVDFTVDYIVGQVVIRNQRALVPGANLQIKFEQNDLFQLASKTLLGLRGDVALGQNTALGFTMMNLNQQTLSDKVRLGEEPNSNTIYGFDGKTSMNLPFLTKAIDALPMLSTKEPSLLTISGEAAYMKPNPNTKVSTIPSDNGSGVAYIDDFEGARRTVPIGYSYAQWTDASPPADSTSNATIAPTDSAKMDSKGRLIWFNRLPSDVHLTAIYPNKIVGSDANNIATVMDLIYIPTKRGAFNYSVNLESTLTTGKNWGGIMKTLSLSAVNLLKENVEAIEIWMRVDKAAPNTKMVIDMGAISEDVIPNKILNSEDRVIANSPVGVLLDGEDVGLDMLSNAQEQAVFSDFVQARKSKEPNLAYDASGDDYSYDNTKTADADYSAINGTEGNGNGPTGRIPDTEDINHNGELDQANSYFEYELPLDTVAARNPNVVGGGFKPADGSYPSWYQFRIPIRNVTRKVGAPTYENVEYFRIFFRNCDTTHVRIADINLVGNQWQKTGAYAGDSLFDVNVVGIEQNPTYVSPPGVQRERDLTHPDQNIQANEQSLDIILKNPGVPAGQSREAVKFYTYKPLDVFNYRTMKMFVHGPPNLQYRDPNDYDAEIYFRFGLDSLNFYEYREPLRPGWDALNDIVIHFSDLTVIKQGRDSINVISRPRPVPGRELSGATFRVLGNPSLTGIVYLAIGVSNPLGKNPHPRPITGEVWFDELRLIDVDNTPGWAYRTDVQLKLADLATVAFNYSRVDPFFHTLDQPFGSRQLSLNWGLSASMSLDKFFPESWVGTTIPISYSHTVSLIKPKYLPNSDIDVAAAAAQAYSQAQADSITYVSQTQRVSDTYAVPTFHIGLPSQEWYIRDTFNKLTFGYTYTRSNERNPSLVYGISWNWNARVSYALTLPPDYFVMPFRKLFDGIWFLDEFKLLKIFFPLSGFNWSISANRSRSNTLQRTVDAQEIVSRQFAASRTMGFAWKLTEGGLMNWYGDYSLSVESSLLGFELDPYGQQRPFSRILSSIFLSNHLINFGDDTRYMQHNAFNTKPSIPNIFNIKKYLDVSGGYSVDYGWQNTLTAGDLGKSAQWSNAINLQFTLRLKQLFDPLFEEAQQAQQPGVPAAPALLPRGRRPSEAAAPTDTSAAADTSGRAKGPPVDRSVKGQLKNLARVFLKIPFLDYENVAITFSQTNQAQNSGTLGTTGFVNFWGRLPFFQDSDPKYGPSRLYQLGLISDPNGSLTNFGPRTHFPFFGWDVVPGPRAANGVLVNTYRETNRLTFKTSRDLWTGARLDLNWNVGWSYNRTQNIQTDSLGHIITDNTIQTTSGSIDRSFLTFPNVLFLGVFKTSLQDVAKRYASLKATSTDSSSNESKLSQAFQEGFEALPILSKLFGQYYPRVNWSLRWDGLEKLPLFAGFVSKLSLDHSYNSTYSRSYENVPGGIGEVTDGQRVAYGFAPLLGANFTFKEVLKGNFGANLRYNTNTSYDLSVSSANIVETLAQEISFTASYSRKGFEIPFFGLSLSNDIDISFNYSITKNSRTSYDVSQLDVNLVGVPLEGTTRTTMEPRIKYVLSQRVSASVYYTYTKIAPDFAGSQVPGSTTNEAGLDIHIAIQ